MGLFGKKMKTEEPSKGLVNPFVVSISDDFVMIEHPERKTEMIRWDDIVEIWFINTDAGPVAPDIWLALIGRESSCLIPTSDCDGYDEVYDIVSKYEGFDFKNVVKSMSCTENERFFLWRKPGAEAILK